MDTNLNPNALNKEMIEYLYKNKVELVVEFDGSKARMFVQKKRDELK